MVLMEILVLGVIYLDVLVLFQCLSDWEMLLVPILYCNSIPQVVSIHKLEKVKRHSQKDSTNCNPLIVTALLILQKFSGFDGHFADKFTVIQR